jgi:DNA polymerase-3 subunit epsilon
MILIFDTETTGLVDDRLPVDHSSQPHIVQIAAQLCFDDGSIAAGMSLIVNPGVEVPSGAAAVHGITTEKARAVGVSPALAVKVFGELYRRADLIVAHNAKFDKSVIEAAIARVYGFTRPLRKPTFCTMEAASPILNLPPTAKMVAAGFHKPKAPKLEQCVRHFFNEDLDGAHDAMVDVVACRRVYFHLKGMADVAAGEGIHQTT